MLAGIFGFFLGCGQFWLLKLTVDYLQSAPKKIVWTVGLKLFLYAAAIAAAFLWFRAYILAAGIGLAIGMLGFSVIYFLLNALGGKNK